MIARIGFHPALIVVRPLAQRLLADLGDADDVAEEVHHQLRPRQRGQIAVNDNPVKAANERRRRIIMNENGGGGRQFVPVSARAIMSSWKSLRWFDPGKQSDPRRLNLEVPFFVAPGNGEHVWQCLEVPPASRSPSGGRRR
jgi:hypothetical protein